jgi:transposase
MYYCGIDIGSKSSFVHVTDRKGNKRLAVEVATTREEFVERLSPYVRYKLAIAIEAGNQTLWIYRVLKDMGALVTVVNPAQVKLIAESRKKTDKIDARTLCELLRIDALPHPVHMPGDQARTVRGLLSARDQLVSARTQLCNSVRGMVRQDGVQLAPRALITQKGWKELLGQGFSLPYLLAVVSSYYDTFKSLTASIRQLDRELAECEGKDPRAARLRTMPRVGRIAALTFLGAVDDVKRFSSSRKLIGYSGLAPTVRSSSERTCYGSITRMGRRELRRVWVQIAHLVAIDTSKASRPLRTWFNRVARKRGKKTAVVALARRLLVIAYQLLKHETDYDPGKVKRAA